MRALAHEYDELRAVLSVSDSRVGLEVDAVKFDVVTEQTFPDRAAMQAWLAAVTGPGNAERVREDEARFIDHTHYFAYVAEEHKTA